VALASVRFRAQTSYDRLDTPLFVLEVNGAGIEDRPGRDDNGLPPERICEILRANHQDADVRRRRGGPTLQAPRWPIPSINQDA